MAHRRPSRWTAAGLLALAWVVTAPAAIALNLDDVIRLKLSGIGEDTILKLVEVEQTPFHLSVQDMIDLKDAGSSDYLIRELMETPERFPDRPISVAQTDDEYDDIYVYDDLDDDYDINIYIEDYEPYDTDDYSVIFSNYYYDPFAYNWYWWPRSYVYYSPFWWTSSSFYYGGHWCRDWWDPWGSCVWYCDWHYGYGHYCGTSRTRIASHRSWNRGSGAAFTRLDRERTLWRKSGTDRPPAVRSKVRSTDQMHRAYRASQVKGRTTDANYSRSRGARRSDVTGQRGPTLKRNASRGTARGGKSSTARRPRYRSGSNRSKEGRAANRASIGRQSKPARDTNHRAPRPKSGSKIESRKTPSSKSPATGKHRGGRSASRSGSGTGKASAPATKEPTKSPSSDRGRSGRR